MANRVTLHIIDGDTRRRAQLARLAFSVQIHAEIYSNMGELVEHAPSSGIVLLYDDHEQVDICEQINEMKRAGLWLTVAAMAEVPVITAVVKAMKAGAVEYMVVPNDAKVLAAIVEPITQQDEEHRKQRARAIEASERVARLSMREREVLERLTNGYSNKAIARELEISPRTVEIHRMKMMGKLGARHAADAVRCSLEAMLINAA